MEHEIGTDVAYRLDSGPYSGKIRYGQIVDIVRNKYVIETATGDLIRATEKEVVCAMDPGWA